MSDKIKHLGSEIETEKILFEARQFLKNQSDVEKIETDLATLSSNKESILRKGFRVDYLIQLCSSLPDDEFPKDEKIKIDDQEFSMSAVQKVRLLKILINVYNYLKVGNQDKSSKTSSGMIGSDHSLNYLTALMNYQSGVISRNHQVGADSASFTAPTPFLAERYKQASPQAIPFLFNNFEDKNN